MSQRSSQAIDALHEFFPRRAQAVMLVLKRENGKAHKTDKWREQQLIKFVAALAELTAELERAYNEKRIWTVAWLTRNLLELSVWIEFCNTSLEHARRFRDDAARDLYGLAQAVQSLELHKTGSENSELKGSQERLATFSRSWRIDRLADDFKRVSDAAEELGRKKAFADLNKMLSKFAHPTAFMVNAVFSSEADAGLRDLFFEDGVAMAIDSLTAIRSFILAYYPEPSTAIP
jgi:hypothetical protein